MATKKRTALVQGRTKKAASKKGARKKNTRKKAQGIAFESEILLWILLAVSILLFVSNFGIGGKVGNAASTFIFGLFGLMAYVFPILLFIGSCFLISNKRNHFAIFKFVASILLFCALCMFLQLLVQDRDMVSSGTIKQAYLYSSLYKAGGGGFGGFFVWLCVPNFGVFGSFVIDIIVMMISMVLITERSILRGMRHGGRKVYETAREDVIRYHDNQQRREEERKLRRIEKKVAGVAVDTSLKSAGKSKSDEISEMKIEPDAQLDGKLPKVQKTEHIPVAAVSKEPQEEIPLPEIFIESVEEEQKQPLEDYEDSGMLEQLLGDVRSCLQF